MHSLYFLTAFTSLFAASSASNAPTYSQYNLQWQDAFIGSSGSLPNTNNWGAVTKTQNYNGEIQTYTSSSSNLKLSGSGSLQILPQKSSSGAWTSARIESKYVFTPTNGKITRIEASLRLPGSASTKQGIWPAFWMLGDSYRHGTVWPACGEIDIMENIDGQTANHGTLHCDVSPGGICNEGTGLGSTSSIPDTNFHVYGVHFDRRYTDYKQQSINFFLDNTLYVRITGAQIGSASVWKALCQSPMYMILNVAVGGSWVSLLFHNVYRRFSF